MPSVRRGRSGGGRWRALVLKNLLDDYNDADCDDDSDSHSDSDSDGQPWRRGAL
jgi:hypothetical protein